MTWPFADNLNYRQQHTTYSAFANHTKKYLFNYIFILLIIIYYAERILLLLYNSYYRDFENYHQKISCIIIISVQYVNLVFSKNQFLELIA